MPTRALQARAGVPFCSMPDALAPPCLSAIVIAYDTIHYFSARAEDCSLAYPGHWSAGYGRGSFGCVVAGTFLPVWISDAGHVRRGSVGVYRACGSHDARHLPRQWCCVCESHHRVVVVTAQAARLRVLWHICARKLCRLWAPRHSARCQAAELMKTTIANQSVERTGASRLGHCPFARQWRLAPAAHAWRSA